MCIFLSFQPFYKCFFDKMKCFYFRAYCITYRFLQPDVRSQDTVFGIGGVTGSVLGRKMAWEFVKKNWKTLYDKYQGGFLLISLIKVTSYINIFISNCNFFNGCILSPSFCVRFHASMSWTGSHNGSSSQSTVLSKFRIEFHSTKIVAY